MALQDLGIDSRVAALLESQGIKELYPPQLEAWEAIRGGGNAVVAIPTASGKSLVAYLAILHRWLLTGRKSLYIVPLRALASEKHEELKAFRDLGLKVGIATGDLDEKDPRLGRFDVIVCTSEKADALLRHRTPWVEDIGCVVADELHLVNDATRGPTLEVILSRFRSIVPDAQVVGLSATIQNAPDVAAWLDAKLVSSQWRPVKLRKGTYFGDRLEFVQDAGADDEGEVRQLASGKDPVAALVEDALEAGGQCLVFVSTRRSAEAQATKLARVVRDRLDPEALAALEARAGDLEAGQEESGQTSRKLRKLIEAGACYHTAGLDAAQRRLVEAAFRAGEIKVLCATPTLAAGVNTPARRVIIRDLTRFEAGYGSMPLPIMEVQQMMGRAGRPRYDPYGEAVLLVKSLEMRDQAVDHYLLGEPEPVTSKLAGDAALRIHALATVAGGYAQSEGDLATFFSHTFWSQTTQDWIIRDRLEDVVWFLEENGFLERDGGMLRATLFGQRTSDLYIDPMSALRIRMALETSRSEPSPFGLLEVVTGCPETYPLYLRASDGWVQERFWECEDEVLLVDDLRDAEQALSYAKTAFLLQDWIDETPMQSLEERYMVGPGDIRLRLDTAKWLVHAFRELARVLQPDWQKPLTDLGMRLDHGIREELLAMVRLRGVGRVRARSLFAAGFKRPGDLAGVPVDTLAALPGFGPATAKALLYQLTGKKSEGNVSGEESVQGNKDVNESTGERHDTKDQVSLHAFGDSL